MTVTAATYQKAKEFAGRKGLSDDVRQRLLGEIQEYESGYQKAIETASPAPLPVLAPIEEAEPLPTQESLVSRLKGGLTPTLPVRPQVLSVQPATTHPEGDKKAADEWVRGDLKNPNKVIVYDEPIGSVRQKLLASPQLVAALGYGDFIPHPQDIMNLPADNAIVQAYQDDLWRKTADEAAKAGKTAYRYTKAPYLQEGGIKPALRSLELKLGTSVAPALEAVQAHIMGADDTANFGAGKRGGETGSTRFLDALGKAIPEADRANFVRHPTRGWVRKDKLDAPVEGPYGEVKGGVIASARPDQSVRELNEMVVEEHPIAHTAGQIAGVAPGLVKGAASAAAGALGMEAAEQGIRGLRSWSVANELYDLVANAAQRLRIPATGPLSTLGKVAAGTVAGGVAGAGTQAAKEGVDAASALSQGQPTSTLDEAGMRIAGAGLSGLEWGGPLSAAHSFAGAVGNWTRTTPRYQGIPGKLERAGVEPRFMRGYITPKTVTEAKKEAEELGVGADEVLAGRVAERVRAGSKAIGDELSQELQKENEAFHASPEGKAPLPVTNFLQMALKKMRGDMEKRVPSARAGRGEVPDPVGTPSKGGEVKELFNNELDDVTVTPVKGAIEASPEEAEAFLTPKNQRLLRRSLEPRPKAAPPEKGPPPRKATAVDKAPGFGDLPPPKPGAPPPPVAKAPGFDEVPPEVPVPRVPSPTVAGARGFEGAPPAGTGMPSPPRLTLERAPGLAPPTPPPPPPPVPPAPRALSKALRARGIKKVYLVPRSHSAEHTETVLDAIGVFRAKSPKNSDLRDLDKAVRKDRDLRPMNGEEGGWSKFKNAQSERLKKAETIERHVAPVNDDAKPAVLAYAKPARGGGDQMKSVRAAADKAGPGVRQELEATRVPVLLDKLDKINSLARKRAGEGITNFLGHAADWGHMRLTYPALRALEGPLGGIGIGAGARVASVSDRSGDDARARRYQETAEGYDERRKAVMEERDRAARPKKKVPRRRRKQP